MYRWFFLPLAAVPLLLFAAVRPSTPISPTPELVWWTTHALDKVRPWDSEPAEPRQTVKISAARNEFEPFQIVLRAQAKDIDGVDVSVTDLRGLGSTVLSKNQVSVYVERYLDLKVPSSVDGAAGEWPDPLVPRIDNYNHEKRNAFPLKLVKGRNQPLWVEVYVPASAAPGSHQGQVQVSVSGEAQLNIPINLEVWNFKLPSTSSLTTTFGFSGIAALRQHYGKYTNDQQLHDMTFLYRKSGLLHRISLRAGFTVPPAYSIMNGHVQVKWDGFDRITAPFMDGLALAPEEPLYGARLTAEALRTPPGLKTAEQQAEFWQQVAGHFRQKGWIDRLFNYLWDEPKPGDYPEMIRIGEVVHRAEPDVKNLVTAALNPEWSGFIDIWTPVINCFERKEGFRHDYCAVAVERSGYDPELAKGKKVWWYQACSSHGCYIVGGDYFRNWPSYMIDHSGLRNRIMEWLTWKYNVQGELYFSTTEAFFKGDPWKDVRFFGGNGDGTLFYPGRPDIIGGATDIPIESIRLKLIREGLEDYEYLVMLSKLAGRETVAQSVDGFLRKTYDYAQDPEKLYAIREWMGRKLNNLSR